MKILALDTKTTETAGKILTEFPNNFGTDTISLSIYDRQMLQYVDDYLGLVCVSVSPSTA